MAEQREAPRYLRRLMFFAVIVESFVSLPQVWQIYHGKDASGVSLVTWSGFYVLTSIWLFYSIKVKDNPIILYSVLSMISEIAVIVGIILY